jgi:hypothetical protein
MTGPQYPAAAGRDQLRAGHTDRDEVIEVLKGAFVDGRLTKDEFGARAGRALAARTRADLTALIDDLPPLPAWPGPDPAGPARPPAPVRRWPLARATAKSALCLVLAFASMWAGAMIDEETPGPSPYDAWPKLLYVLGLALIITAFGILAAGAATAVEQRRARRNRRPNHACQRVASGRCHGRCRCRRSRSCMG